MGAIWMRGTFDQARVLTGLRELFGGTYEVYRSRNILGPYIIVRKSPWVGASVRIKHRHGATRLSVRGCAPSDLVAFYQVNLLLYALLQVYRKPWVAEVCAALLKGFPEDPPRKPLPPQDERLLPCPRCGAPEQVSAHRTSLTCWDCGFTGAGG